VTPCGAEVVRRSVGSAAGSARAARRQLAGATPRRAWLLLTIAVSFACAAPPAGGPVVLVVVDTLRADHLGSYGQARGTSPQLDAWAREGRLYERAWSTSSWTLPSVASLLTGRLPHDHGAVALVALPAANPLFGALAAGVPTLAERFAAAGYATAAFVTNPYLTPLLGIDRGFGLYDHTAAYDSAERRAAPLVERALHWIDAQQGRPFFLLLHLMDPHLSYDAPAPQRGRFTAGEHSQLRLPVRAGSAFALRAGRRPRRAGGGALDDGDRRFVAAAYDEEVAYVDAQLGRLREALASTGVLERGLLVLASDHGEELFDHGGFEHGHALFEEVVRVPLVFWGAGVRPGREATPVSLVDVAPTLLEAAGLPRPDGVAGISLWPNLHDGAALPERTLRFEDVLYGEDRRGALRWPWKVVVSEGGALHYWNLERDPDEREPGRRNPPVAVVRLLAELDAEGAPATPRPTPLDTATLEELRGLGYLEDPGPEGADPGSAP
jgi:choline-sulfatase